MEVEKTALLQFTPGPVNSRIQDLIEKDYPLLFALYCQFHSEPELSGKERQTSDRLAMELGHAGCIVTRNVGGYGVVGVMVNGPGPVLMVRADMDALPIEEETGLPYASAVTTADPSGTHGGVMHACGHDLHMTALAGTARILWELRDIWSGTAIFVGQPEEEIVSGAAGMIRDGLFSRFPLPCCAIALHAGPDLPEGMIGFREGVFSAGTESIDIVVQGIGGHAAHPDKARDPVVLAAQIVMALQTIISREVPQDKFALLTVGSIHGGTKHNAIPNEVKLEVNIRFFDCTIRDALIAAIRRICRGCAESAGIPQDRMPRIQILPQSVPPICNDPGLTKEIVQIFQRNFGTGRVIRIDPLPGSEDFGLFGMTRSPIPLCYFRIGTGYPGASYLHSSRFAPHPETSIRNAVASLALAALGILRRGSLENNQ